MQLKDEAGISSVSRPAALDRWFYPLRSRRTERCSTALTCGQSRAMSARHGTHYRGGSPRAKTIAFSPTFAQDQRLWLRGVVGGHPSLEHSGDAAQTWTGITLPLINAPIRDLAATGSATG